MANPNQDISISRERDITPMRGIHFPTISPTDRNYDQSLQYYNKYYFPQVERTMQMQSQLLNLKRQQLAFREQRDERRMQKEFLKSVPMIKAKFSELDSIIDPKEKKAALIDLKLEYANSLTRSPVIGNMFSTVESGINDQISEQAREAAKGQGVRNSMVNSLVNSMISTGSFDPELIQKVSDTSIPLSELSESISDSFAKAKEAREAAALAEKQLTAGQKQEKEFKAQLDKIYGEVVALGSVGDDDEGKIKFNAKEESDLLRNYRLLTGSKQSDAEIRASVNDDFGVLREKILFQLRKATGITSSLTPSKNQQKFSQ